MSRIGLIREHQAPHPHGLAGTPYSPIRIQDGLHTCSRDQHCKSIESPVVYSSKRTTLNPLLQCSEALRVLVVLLTVHNQDYQCRQGSPNQTVHTALRVDQGVSHEDMMHEDAFLAMKLDDQLGRGSGFLG
jgi:hypothetical protein